MNFVALTFWATLLRHHRYRSTGNCMAIYTAKVTMSLRTHTIRKDCIWKITALWVTWQRLCEIRPSIVGTRSSIRFFCGTKTHCQHTMLQSIWPTKVFRFNRCPFKFLKAKIQRQMYSLHSGNDRTLIWRPVSTLDPKAMFMRSLLICSMPRLNIELW